MAKKIKVTYDAGIYGTQEHEGYPVEILGVDCAVFKTSARWWRVIELTTNKMLCVAGTKRDAISGSIEYANRAVGKSSYETFAELVEMVKGA